MAKGHKPPEPPRPLEPSSDLPTEPWMKHAGVSFWAAIVVWFKRPRRYRPRLLMPVAVTGAIFTAAFLVVWLLAVLIGKLIGD